MLPWPRRPVVPPRVDLVVAAVVLALSLLQVAIVPIAHPAVSLLVAVGSAAAVAWRRVAPTAAALGMTAVWSVPTPEGFLLLGYVMAGLVFYSLGAHVPQPWRVVAVGALAASVGVVTTLLGPEEPPAAIGAVLVVAGPAVAGRLVAHQRAQNAQLRALTDELVRERAAAERTAVAEERARIARELHDAIGHDVTVIALQADAAAAALAKAPERAAAPVAAIRASAAEALAEMRRVVGLLREPADGGGREAEADGELAPQPGLADLPALVERSRTAGARVELVLRPPAAPPPQTVQVTAYRLVQESLTNARRHAPGSSVHVRVDGDGVALCVEVASEGGRAVPAAGRTTGHGLVGMRERVRMLGGDLQAGPTPGGFLVRARLPADVGLPS